MAAKGHPLSVDDKDEKPSALPVKSVTLLGLGDALDVGPRCSFTSVARREVLINPRRSAEETELKCHPDSL
jgi:hypothetical protein